MSTDLYGFVAAFLTTIAFLPQVLRTYKTKSADDVSILMLLMFISGLCFWIIYGSKLHSLPVVIANTITLILNSSILAMKLAYSLNDSKRDLTV